MTIRVFLGGTCNGSTWREELKPMLDAIGVNYYDPVVSSWDFAAQQRELLERKICDYCLYVITPEMNGFYSIAEVVDDSNKRPEKTIICTLERGLKKWDHFQIKSLVRIEAMVDGNGGIIPNTIDSKPHS